MENIRYHLSVKDDRAIWSAGRGLPEIVLSEDETIRRTCSGDTALLEMRCIDG